SSQTRYSRCSSEKIGMAMRIDRWPLKYISERLAFFFAVAGAWHEPPLKYIDLLDTDDVQQAGA
ncbi:unnamed protein product, partial [marine sediment metagenome]